MNYDEARQIEASGKWNWTTMNDGRIRTAPPCYYPDFDWEAADVRDAIVRGEKMEPTGRERCDHPDRLSAEQHYWESQLHGIREERLDLDTIRERSRCQVPHCWSWEDWRMHWPGGYVIDSLCDRHRFESGNLHPFREGIQVIHS